MVRDIRVTGVAKGLEDLNRPVVPADVSPEDAKPVADFSYLPENRVLTRGRHRRCAGRQYGYVGGFGRIHEHGGRQSLAELRAEQHQLERRHLCGSAECCGQREGRHRLDRCGNLLVLCPDRGGHLYQRCGGGRQRVFREVQGYFNSEAAGLKYYVEEDGAFVEKATTEDTWKHIFLPADMTAGSASTCPRWSAVPGI